MHSFINKRESIVSDTIDGVVAASSGRLSRFPVDHAARVVVRTDWDKSKVAIISGGGSGHEPAHAGFVGSGMLTAAVCGDVFASPSVDAVLSAIITVTGTFGCLLIIKNYTGDRLNFGLAAEKAKALGFDVEMIVVADDVSIPGAAKPRGVAGVLFVHKLAGYLSETDESLSSIHDLVSKVNRTIVSLGVSRDTCTMPGNTKSTRLSDAEVEIGLGIHGEPGVEVATFDSAKELIATVSTRLEEALDQSDSRYAVLLNNLGGLSRLEIFVLFSEFMQTPLGARADIICGPAAVVTALDMPGFSLSLVPLDELMIDALRYKVGVNSWFDVTDRVTKDMIVVPEPLNQEVFSPSENEDVRRIIEAMAMQCISMETEINALDALVGDGDTGSTFAGAAQTVLADLDKLPLNDTAALFRALSDIKTRSMGGSSGVLFAIFFEAAADAFQKDPSWSNALLCGLHAMKRYGGAVLGDRTMIDALEPALDVLISGGSLQSASVAARKGADSTALMDKAGAGRSSYLNSRSLHGVIDPGAEAVTCLLESIA